MIEFHGFMFSVLMQTFSDKFHGTRKTQKDGVEKLLKMFVITICAVALISPLVIFTWIIKKVHLWSILDADINPISLMLCMSSSSVVLVDCGNIFFLLALGFNYIKMTDTSLNKMT